MYKDDDAADEKRMSDDIGGQLLFKTGDGNSTREDREKDTRGEIQLTTTEAKGELN